MLNLTPVQKHLSAFRNVHHKGSKNFILCKYIKRIILCKYIKRKTKYNKGVTRTDDCLVTSHSTMLTVVRIFQSSFISGRKLDAGYGTFLSFETENWICWLLRHHLNFLCELNLIGQQIFNVSP